jgi:predicted phage-related endonuclease
MSQNEIITTVSELQELKRMQEELNAEIETLQDRIKAHMTEQGAEQIVAGAHKVSWMFVSSARLDTTALKKALPEVAERFTKTTTTRRFTVA